MAKLLKELRNKKLTVSEKRRLLHDNTNRSIPGMDDLLAVENTLASILKQLWNKYVISDELKSLLEKHPSVIFKRKAPDAKFVITGYELGIFDSYYPSPEDENRISTDVHVSVPKDDKETVIVSKEYLWGWIKFDREALNKVPEGELENVRDLVSSCVEKRYEINKWKRENLNSCQTFSHVYKVSPQIYLDLVKQYHSEAMFQEAAKEDMKATEAPTIAPTRSESRRSNEELNQGVLENLKATLYI